MLGAADRAATPPGGIEAAAGSWTIGSEKDGPRAVSFGVMSKPSAMGAAQVGTARARRAGLPKAEPGAGSAGRGTVPP
jgi:hypothetical protein